MPCFSYFYISSIPDSIMSTKDSDIEKKEILTFYSKLSDLKSFDENPQQLVKVKRDQILVVKDKDEFVINGRKWWSSGGMNPRTKIYILMGKTDPTASRHVATSQQVSLVCGVTKGRQTLPDGLLHSAACHRRD